MKGARMKALWAILRGFLTAAAATLLGMLLLAAAVIYLEVSDGALAALNQLLKLLCVALGARFAVGVGGERGFFTGAAVGLLYMAVGYALYWQLGGGAVLGRGDAPGDASGRRVRRGGGRGVRQPASPRAAARQSGESMTKIRRPRNIFARIFFRKLGTSRRLPASKEMKTTQAARWPRENGRV